jgi:fumarate reductase subunit D
VAGAALLYALYHVGYGMGGEEIWFLFGLGVVYAIIYRLTTNILILWPLLTPLGAFFNSLQSGDIELPWASILGFVDVGILMAVAVWLAHRHIRKRSRIAIDDRVKVLTT